PIQPSVFAYTAAFIFVDPGRPLMLPVTCNDACTTCHRTARDHRRHRLPAARRPLPHHRHRPPATRIVHPTALIARPESAAIMAHS
ncbi:hypothetical protein ACLOJK_027606, partial [Asimina triloba]